MKQAHLFNKWYRNKYEQEYIFVLLNLTGVEIFNIIVCFSRKHNNFWTDHNRLSQLQYPKYFFNAKQKNK
jgi:hypothetical protein